MQVYGYNQEGYFQGVIKAQPNPMSLEIPGEPAFLFPSHTTPTPPPEVPENKVAKWNGDFWVIEDCPEYIAALAEADKRKPVLFYRWESGKDTVVIDCCQKGAANPDGTGYRYLEHMLNDSSSVRVLELDDATGWDERNINGVFIKKVVDGCLITREPRDIFLDDAVAQSRMYAVIYRNRPGSDKKVVAVQPWVNTAGGIPVIGGKLVTEVPTLGYFFMENLSPNEAEALSLKTPEGVACMRANSDLSGVEFRDEADQSKDRNNAGWIKRTASQSIAQTFVEVTGIDAEPLEHALMAQEALVVRANPDGLSSPQEVEKAKSVLGVYRLIYRLVEEIRQERDRALSKLDAEDY